MRIRVGLAIAAAVATVGTGTAAARAATRLDTATGVRVAYRTATTLTVTADRAVGASGYRVFASTRRSDLYVANIARAHASPVRSTPRVTVTGLTYSTTAPTYFRMQTLNGSRHRLEATIHSTWLRPGVPGSFRLVRNPAYVTWTPANVTGYLVVQATNAAMTTGRRTYTLSRLTNQFTPYGLATGHSYWFRVYGVNHGVSSLPTAAGSVTVTEHQQALSVMTYNVLEANTAGQVESGTTIPSWSSRRPGVVALIDARRPDVVAVQEAAAFVGSVQGPGGTRQADDLATALGGAYQLARTEVPPTEPHYQRTANYLLYRAAAWRATSLAGHWDIGDGHWAAYQELHSTTTAARVLVISTHLATGNGSANDAVRQRETATLVRLATSAARGEPIVYGGDFNSDVNRNHAFDGPGLAMRAARVADAEKVAQTQVNQRYNSANLYLRTPPAVDQSIDYVYAGPGVAVASREVVLHLVSGKFPGVIPSDHNPVLCRAYVPY